MTTSSPSRIILLRHGATEESALGRFSGRADIELSAVGREQAARWAPVIDSLPDAPVAFTSPLRRAAETASLAGIEAQALPDLVEWDLGSLEGLSADGVRQENPGWSLFTQGPPDGTGETPEAVAQRCRSVLERLVDAPGETVIAVAHGQFLRALTVAALGLEPATARHLSFGPARAAVLMRRRTGRLSLAGWNMAPSTGMLDDLT